MPDAGQIIVQLEDIEIGTYVSVTNQGRRTRSASLAYTLEIHTEENTVIPFLVPTAYLLCVFYLDLVVKCGLLNVEIDSLITANHKPLIKDLSPQDKVGKV